MTSQIEITELLQKYILIQNVIFGASGQGCCVCFNSVTAKKWEIIAYWYLRKVKIKQNLMTTTLTTEQNSNT